jgi:endonuclease/exonuclease/phosphatase family metal-dependent hydrolase
MLFASAVMAQTMPVTELKVGTFNIRNSGANDGDDAWPHRRPLLVDTIRRADPDLVGLQEVLPDQQANLVEDLSDYATVAVFRDDGKTKGEASSIFYRKARFDLIDSGTFWLSQTPEVAGSFGWDAACTRICTWAKLKDRRNGQILLAANTHFDHVGVKARANSAKLIAERLRTFSDGGAVLLTGDFNAIETGPVYPALLEAAKSQGLTFVDTYRAVHPQVSMDEASYHGFKDETKGLRIDWIFVSPQLVTESSEIDHSKSKAGRFPSDHYPIWATLRYAK